MLHPYRSSFPHDYMYAFVADILLSLCARSSSYLTRFPPFLPVFLSSSHILSLSTPGSLSIFPFLHSPYPLCISSHLSVSLSRTFILGCRCSHQVAPVAAGAVLVLTRRHNSRLGRAQRPSALRVRRTPAPRARLPNHKVSLESCVHGAPELEAGLPPFCSPHFVPLDFCCRSVLSCLLLVVMLVF